LYIISTYLIYLLVITIIFNNFFKFLTGAEIISLADEVLFIWVIFYITYEVLLNRMHKFIGILFSVVALFITVSIYTGNSPLFKIVVQAILHIKFFLFAYFFYKQRAYINLYFLFKTIFFITLLGILVNLFLGSSYYSIVGVTEIYRSELLPRIIGFQFNANLLSLVLSVSYIYISLALKTTTRKFIFITSGFTILILLTGSRSALVVFPIVAYIFFMAKEDIRRVFKIAISIFITLIFLSILFYLRDSDIFLKTSENISLMTDAEDTLYIRAIMIYYSFILAEEYFPFGAGVATFGSVLSQNSVIYQKLGIAHLHFFEEMEGVYDSNLASILGELGIFGIAVYIFLLYKTYKLFNFSNRVYIFALTIFIFLISSKTAVFFQGYSSTLFGIGLAMAGGRRDENIADK
jgi:hypothetical protein